jgi:hypothetical protein
MDQFDYLRFRIIDKFDELVQKGEYHWKTQQEIADLTGISITKVAFLVMFSGEFVKDSKEMVTTRKYYEKKTPFFKKIKDSCLGTIV